MNEIKKKRLNYQLNNPFIMKSEKQKRKAK